MVKITIDNVEQFKVFFDTVFDVASDSVELKFYTDHLTCALLDGNRARFFYVEYEMKFFEEYDVEETTSVVVSLEDMFKLLKISKNTDTLTLEFDETKMYAECISSNGNKRVFEFVLPDDYVQSPTLPQVQLPSHIEVAVDDIERSIKDIGMFGVDIFQFVLSENTITFMSDTTTDIHSTNTVKYAQIIEAETGVTDVLAVRFTLSFIEQMCKFKKISKSVSLDVGEVALVYKFRDEVMGVTVNGMIAPRVEIEEDE